jgi:hypothetical protein
MTYLESDRQVAQQIDKKTLAPARISAGLLWNDRRLIVPCLFILSLSTAGELLGSVFGYSLGLGALFIERTLQVLVVTGIVQRWRRRLHAQRDMPRSFGAVFFRIAVVSFTASLMLTTPFMGIVSSPNGMVATLFLVLLIVGCVWTLRLYFYFVAVSIFGLNVRSGIARAVDISRRSPLAAVYSLVAPIAITLLIVSVCLSPAPDGRSLLWITLAACSENLFWLLSTYTAVGYALALSDDPEWRAAGLDHYRTDRLLTLQAQGSQTVARILTPGRGIMTMVIALCIAGGNLVRQLQQPPAAEVSVARVWTADYSIKVELSVKDPEYQFRGFNPAAFSIASKTGFAISQQLVAASDGPDGKGILVDFQQGRAQQGDENARPLYLTFRSTKSGDALRSLDNMWLWYKLAPLLPITPEQLTASAAP